MIRKGAIGDAPAILGLAGQLASRYPKMAFSADRVRSQLSVSLSTPNDLILVSGEGPVKDVLAAVSYDTPWATKKTAAIVLFYSETPGAGLAMLREFCRWVDKRPVIRQSEIGIDNLVDPRIEKLMARLGWAATDTVYRRFRK